MEADQNCGSSRGAEYLIYSPKYLFKLHPEKKQEASARYGELIQRALSGKLHGKWAAAPAWVSTLKSKLRSDWIVVIKVCSDKGMTKSSEFHLRKKDYNNFLAKDKWKDKDSRGPTVIWSFENSWGCNKNLGVRLHYS